ncbi:MAG: PH domain-containing protein [Patescibacteria group bacterium]|jgi:uncharacterized membrane protein YdbT with pleckstrin-like domain
MNLDQLIKRKPDEKVIFFLRRHWVIFAAEILLIIVLAAVPFGGDWLLSNLWPQLLLGPHSRPILILLLSAYYLMIWVFFLSYFIDYYLDGWIVTDDRILSVEQRGLFSRTISELDLAKIQDVTSEGKGFLAFLFNYGYVYVQTASEIGRFTFEQIPKPHEVRRQLLSLIEADRKKQGEIGQNP